MIAMTKDQAKHRFAARLNELLDEMGVPERGRRQWLSRRFNAAFSPEAARKWLEAETMPDQPHFSMLCTAFNWGFDYLMTGRGPKYVIETDPVATEVAEILTQLDEDARQYILRISRNERDLRGTRTIVRSKRSPAQATKRRQQRPTR